MAEVRDLAWDRMQLYDTARGQFCIRELGAGPPLVLLHPLALSSQVWAPVARRLCADFRVLSVDARGHGRSGWDGADFSVRDMADDLGALLDTLSLETVNVMGMSMGGCTAVAFAGAYPDRVSRLVLCDTTAWYGPQAPEQWAQRARRARAVPRVYQVPFQTERWFTDQFRRSRPARVNQVVGAFLATTSKAHAAASGALGAFDGRELTGHIMAPTLVMTGEGDYATPTEMGSFLASSIPDARFVSLPNVRHLSLMERPDLADVVSGFLLQTDDRARI